MIKWTRHIHQLSNKSSDYTESDNDNLESKLGKENCAFVWLEKDLCQILIKAQTQHPALVVWN